MIKHLIRLDKEALASGARVLGVCLALAAAARPAAAAPVPPTNNTTGPKFGLYEWGLQDENHPGESRDKWMATALNRNTVWVEDFMDYSSWGSLEGSSYEFDPAYDFIRENPGAVFVLTEGLLPGYQGTPLSGYSLAGGAANTDVNNDYLSHFVKLAQNLVTYGIANQTVIRLGHEFNGNWYPWQVDTDADALNYAAYWRNVVTAMHAVSGASGIKFCWNGTTDEYDSYPVADAYPGDSYVDYVGTDIYDSSYTNNTYPYPNNDSAADILTRQQNAWAFNSGTSNNGLAVWKNIAVAHSKPLAIPEWGLCSGFSNAGLDDPYYIQQMYNFIQDPANNVAFHIYFDVWANDGNHQISQSPSEGPNVFPNASALFFQLFAVPPFTVNNDIGSTGLAGGCTAFAATGAGAGFLSGGTADNFHLASQAISGDTLLLADVTSMSSATTGQSGLMIRQSAAAGDLYAALYISNGCLIFQSRTAANAAATQNFVTNSVTAPVWLKMLRTGNVITGYESTDGLNWTYAGGQTVNMSAAAYAGVALSSGSTSVLNTTGISSVNDADIAADYYNTSTSAETSSTPAITGAVIVDSAATSGVAETGAWNVSGSQANLYGGTMITSYSPNSGATATFTPTIPTAGQYDVYITAPGNYQDGDKSPVQIVYAGGTWSGTFNEQGNDGLWVHLGTFNFNAGTSGNLSISNTGTTDAVGGHGFVTVDGVMFVPVPTVTAPQGTMSLTQGTTTASTMVVSWAAIPGATSYTIGYQTSNSSYSSVTTSGTSVTLTGLQANSWYWIEGQASNSAGGGPWTNTYSFQTAQVSQQPPQGTMSITQGTTTSTTMVVSWGAIAGATSYTIGYQSSGTSYLTNTTSGTSVTLTGLTPNTWYWIEGQASNSAGSGPRTNTYSFQTGQ